MADNVMHRAIVVISLSLEQPDGLTEALHAINPQSIPHADQVRVAIDPVASAVIDWLDADEQVSR